MSYPQQTPLRFVGVKPLTFPWGGVESFKRDALIFEKLMVCNHKLWRAFGEKFDKASFLHDFDWLVEQGFIQLYEVTTAKVILAENYPLWRKHKRVVDRVRQRLNRQKPVEEWIEVFAMVDSLSQVEVRLASVELRTSNVAEAFPIGLTSFDSELIADKRDVLEIVLKYIPVPDEQTSWEQLMEYRHDPDLHLKFSRLRSWINEVARMELKPNEIKDKLETLIREYETHIHNYKIKTRLETFKTIVLAEAGLFTSGWLAGLGALPGLAGMVVTPLYSIRQRNMALLEEEQRAPGKEVAYIATTRERF